MQRRNWTREELIAAFHLYCTIPFGQMHKNNLKVINLANLLKRTPSAVAYKLVNFASLDPNLQKRGIVGAKHGAKADAQVWQEFRHDWESLVLEAEQILQPLLPIVPDTIELPKATEREVLMRVRVNQNFFRTAVLASYKFQCCITGLPFPELLNASHIVPWSHSITERVNPTNGLCLNSLHDRAFDRGLLTISPEYRIIISRKLLNSSPTKTILEQFQQFHNQAIYIPEKFPPHPDFLRYHNENIFQDTQVQ
jgi:putative restriction endonuclease